MSNVIITHLYRFQLVLSFFFYKEPPCLVNIWLGCDRHTGHVDVRAKLDLKPPCSGSAGGQGWLYGRDACARRVVLVEVRFQVFPIQVPVQRGWAGNPHVWVMSLMEHCTLNCVNANLQRQKDGIRSL